jgi:hypothetical protein
MSDKTPVRFGRNTSAQSFAVRNDHDHRRDLANPFPMPRALTCPTDRGRRVPVGLLWLLATVAVGAVMLGLSAGANVAPVIEADNAYIFMAADRLFTGEGATAIPPRAPLQPWSWRADWVFLTQWPVGYPALICATRWVTGLATPRAAMMLGALSCAIGLGAWFAWARACLPRRIPALLIAVVVAGASFSVQNLVHPASDTDAGGVVASGLTVGVVGRRACRAGSTDHRLSHAAMDSCVR